VQAPIAIRAPAAPKARATPGDVVSYVEETYVCGPGDSFESISRAKYETDRYARALYLFNRSHPLAGDELLQDDRLKAQQRVYLPPTEILESRYPGAIQAVKEASPTDPPAVSVGASPRRADAPPAADPRAAAPPMTPGRYRVGAGGEKLYDIARKLLGDGNRWVEIERLNRGLNPELPIPEGTFLQVPGDAHLPQ
jgi:nucleoid-associated protein YgaU